MANKEQSKQEIQQQIQQMNKDIEDAKDYKKGLRQMELFVLDNSLRESTVGQLRGHTIENKWKIYNEVRVYWYPLATHYQPRPQGLLGIQNGSERRPWPDHMTLKDMELI